MWRRTLIIGAIAIGIVAGTLLGLTSDRVADNLRQRLILLARQSYGLELVIGELELGFLPLTIEARNVRIRRPEEDSDWVRLHSGSVQIRPWPSSAGALVVDSLTLDGLFFDARQIGDGNAEAEDDGKNPKIDVRQVAMWNSHVIVPTPDGSADLRELDFTMVPQSRGGRSVDLRLGRGELLVDDEVLDFDARIRGEFRGTVDRPKEIELAASEIELPRLSLRAEGSADLSMPVPGLNFRLAADVDLEQLGTLPIDLPPLKGKASPALVLTGTALAPEIRLEVQGEDVHIERAELGDVALDVVYEANRVVVESFEVKHPRGGRVTGSGSVGLEELDLALTARLHEVRVQDVLAEAGLPDSWIRLVLNSDARATGTLSPLGIEVELDGAADTFEVLGATYRDRDSEKFLELASVPIVGRAAITKDMVLLNGMNLGPENARLALEGMLHYDDGLDLRARSESIDLGWFGPIGKVPFGGRGPVAAAIEGPYKKPVVSATVEIEDFSMLDFAFGDTKGTLVFENPTLQLERINVRRGDGRVDGAGNIRFKDGVLLQLAADIEDVEAGAAMMDLNLPPFLGSKIRGNGSGRLLLSGSPLDLEGLVSVRSKSIAYDGVPLGEATVEVGFGGEREKIVCEIGLVQESSLVDARIGWLEDGTMDLKGQVANVPLPSMRHFLGNADVDGLLNGRFSLTGPPSRLGGSASAQLRSLEVYGARFGVTKVRAQVREGQAQLEGTLLNGGIVANGTIRLSEKLPFNVSASFSDLAGERMVDLGPRIQSSLTGSLFAQGPILEPTRVIADARLDRWSVTIADETLVATRTVNLNWANQTLLIPDAAFRGPDLRLVVSGRLPTQSPMQLQVNGDGSLSSLALVSSRVSRGSGELKFGVGISGTPAQPSLDGELSIEDGELLLSGQKRPATQINGKISFSGAAANIDYAQFRYGGGSVSLGGQLVVGGNDGTEASVRADFDRVALDPARDIDATVSGNLVLLGPLDDLRLRGSVNIDELSYTRNVNLTSIIPRRGSRPPLSVPTVESTEAIGLSIKVTADETISFSNNVLDATLKADLTLTGTTNRMGLLGTVTPVRAQARYAGNLYELERGSIDFTEEYEIYSRFSLRATTEACGIDVTVDVFGDSEAYNVSPSGTDDVGVVDPQEVLVCLQFGTRQRDFSSGGAPVTSSAVGGVDDELAAAVSGLDALWTVSGLDDRVREVLPIDEVRITNAWSPQANGIRPRLVLGKEIGEAVRLQYYQSIFNEDQEETYQALSIQYELSRRATLEGTWLSEYQTEVPVTDLGLDLRLRWELR